MKIYSSEITVSGQKSQEEIKEIVKQHMLSDRMYIKFLLSQHKCLVFIVLALATIASTCLRGNIADHNYFMVGVNIITIMYPPIFYLRMKSYYDKYMTGMIDDTEVKEAK